MINTIHPEAVKMMSIIADSGEKPMQEMTFEEARTAADARGIRLNFPRREGVISEDKTISGTHGDLNVRVYKPEKPVREGKLPILIYVHGGGMVVGGIEVCDAQCRALCLDADMVVTSLNYHLSPEYKFPVGVEDVLEGADWVYYNAEALGGDNTRMAVMGESSGGALSAVISHKWRDMGRDALKAQVLIYPVCDYSIDYDSYEKYAEGYFFTKAKAIWMWELFMNSWDDIKDPLCSPILWERFDNLPPALIITSGYDPLKDGAVAYANKLKENGNIVEYQCYENWPHGFFYWGGTSAAERSLAAAVDMLKRI